MRGKAISVVALAVLYGACGPAPQQQPAEEPAASPIDEESKAVARQGDEQVIAAQKRMDEEINRHHDELKKALGAALGKEAPYPGQPAPAPASQSIAEVRKAGIELALTPVLDQSGKPVAGQFLQLEDSFSKRLQEISPKISAKKATKAEMKFVQDGAQHVPKINNLKAQVRLVVMPAMQSAWMVATGAMTTMATVANMIKTRKHMEMEWTERDYELVQQLLERQSRREAVAALSQAMLAAYQAVVNGKAEPKLIDDVASAGLEAMPLQGKASIEDAKKLVEKFDQHVAIARKVYEEQMRAAFGDAEYAAKYRAGIESTFASMAAATSTQSASELVAEVGKKYREDIQKCARGEKLDSGTMVGPQVCKDAKAAANPDGTLDPGKLDELAGGAVARAKAKAEEGAFSLLDAIPGVAQVKLAVEGVVALTEGDPAKALRIASELVPIPGVSGALKTASGAVAAADAASKK